MHDNTQRYDEHSNVQSVSILDVFTQSFGKEFSRKETSLKSQVQIG
jgi:hypothetical protein